MAKYTYAFPAVFTKEENGAYSVRFPDIDGCFTSGEDLPEAINMAEDALSLMLYDMEEEGKEIPPASDIQTLPLEAGEFASMIAADTMDYRKKYNSRAVKKTLTIPAWLNTMAEREEINCSAVFQAALKNTLHLNDK